VCVCVCVCVCLKRNNMDAMHAHLSLTELRLHVTAKWFSFLQEPNAKPREI
jgi:hypothetical protein